MSGFNYLTFTDLIRMTEVLKLCIITFAAGLLIGGTFIAWLGDKFTIEIGHGVCVYHSNSTGVWCAKFATYDFNCKGCGHYIERGPE